MVPLVALSLLAASGLPPDAGVPLVLRIEQTREAPSPRCKIYDCALPGGEKLEIQGCSGGVRVGATRDADRGAVLGALGRALGQPAPAAVAGASGPAWLEGYLMQTGGQFVGFGPTDGELRTPPSDKLVGDFGGSTPAGIYLSYDLHLDVDPTAHTIAIRSGNPRRLLDTLARGAIAVGSGWRPLGDVHVFGFDRHNQLLISADLDGGAALSTLDPATLKTVQLARLPEVPLGVACASAADVCLAMTRGELWWAGPKRAAAPVPLNVQPDFVDNNMLSPDGRYLAVSSDRLCAPSSCDSLQLVTLPEGKVASDRLSTALGPTVQLGWVPGKGGLDALLAFEGHSDRLNPRTGKKAPDALKVPVGCALAPDASACIQLRGGPDAARWDLRIYDLKGSGKPKLVALEAKNIYPRWLDPRTIWIQFPTPALIDVTAGKLRRVATPDDTARVELLSPDRKWVVGGHEDGKFVGPATASD